jgi:hypothetical protein
MVIRQEWPNFQWSESLARHAFSDLGARAGPAIAHLRFEPLITMRALFVFIVVLASWHCSGAPSKAEQELSDIWRTNSASVEQRATAINKCFINGTPIAHVVSILGTNYITVPAQLRFPLPGAKTKTRQWLHYSFQDLEVVIDTTAPGDADPLAYSFVRAGYESRKRQMAEIIFPHGQQDGAANRSHPIRSATNTTSGAAGSRR